MYDDGVVFAVAHSVWTRNVSGEAVTLSFSLSFSHFSLTVVLLFSLFPVVYSYRFLFFSLLFYLSFLFTQLMFGQLKKVHTIIHTFLARVECSFSILFVYASKNSCLSCSMIGCNLTASSDEEKDGEKKRRTKKKLSLALLFFFVIRLPRACRSLLEGMWYMLCTIMMWNRHKRSLGVVIDCVCYTGWTKAPGYRSHMSHEVFIIRMKKKKRELTFFFVVVWL
jgi:hypothetical protein